MKVSIKRNINWNRNTNESYAYMLMVSEECNGECDDEE